MNSPLPTPLAVFPEFTPFVEAQWRAHLSDDFGSLASIPSAGVRLYCAALRHEPSLATFEALMAHAKGVDSEADRSRLVAQMQSLQPTLAEGPVFLRKAFLAEAATRVTDEAQRTRIAAALAALTGVDTPKAADVRKAINAVLKVQFGKPLKSGRGGNWTLDFDVNGATVALDVDTGGMSRGFRYWLRPQARPGPSSPSWFAYETLLGLPGTAWDLLRTDRLDEQMALWSRNLASVHAAMEEVYWRPSV